MTYRLVGLMSFVLLLSLAAFALLMNSYQEEVMGEVTRTVSAVGRATLQTFERRFPPGGVEKVSSPPAGPEKSCGGFTCNLMTGALPEGSAVMAADHVAIIHVDPRQGKGGGEIRISGEDDRRVMVWVEEVRAESDGAGDTLLRIPTMRVQEEAAKTGAGHTEPTVCVLEGPAGARQRH